MFEGQRLLLFTDGAALGGVCAGDGSHSHLLIPLGTLVRFLELPGHAVIAGVGVQVAFGAHLEPLALLVGLALEGVRDGHHEGGGAGNRVLRGRDLAPREFIVGIVHKLVEHALEVGHALFVVGGSELLFAVGLDDGPGPPPRVAVAALLLWAGLAVGALTLLLAVMLALGVGGGNVADERAGERGVSGSSLLPWLVLTGLLPVSSAMSKLGWLGFG